MSVWLALPSPAQSEDGLLLNVVAFGDEGRSAWEVYGPDYVRRFTSDIPIAYRIWDRCRNGDLIASREDGETGEIVLARIRLTLEGHDSDSP